MLDTAEVRMRSHHRCWLPPYSGPAEHSSPEECCDATVDTVPWPGPDGCDSLATVTCVKWESLRDRGEWGKEGIAEHGPGEVVLEARMAQ